MIELQHGRKVLDVTITSSSKKQLHTQTFRNQQQSYSAAMTEMGLSREVIDVTVTNSSTKQLHTESLEVINHHHPKAWALTKSNTQTKSKRTVSL